MEKKNQSISISKLGMNRDAHPSNLKEAEYSFAKNANIEDSSGNGLPNLQNEPSNILCAKFTPEWKVIGFLKDLNGDTTYFFMSNEVTGESEIGKIDTINNIKDVEDLEAVCGCGIKYILNEPLETQDPQATCTYETIINDACNKCLNFSVKNPIRDPQIKDEKCGKRLYWTDGNNPPRFINLSDLDQYKEIGIKTCDTDVLPQTCLDCDKLRIFPCFEIPCMNPESIQNGGNLKQGTYEFLLAYCDKQGNEISEYFSIVNPISIFDENNTIIDQTELDARTTFGIRLKVEGLDPKFGYYKVAVIQRTDVNQVTSYFIEGIHETTDNTVIYTTELDKERTTLQNLAAQKPYYKTSEHMTSSNGYLFQAGLTSEPEYNLQPIANLLGTFTRWMTVQADEDIYKDGINTSLYKSYLRNETYPLGIRFTGDCGYITALYPLVSRVATDAEMEVVHNGTTGITTDVNSVYASTPACYKTDRKYRWQYEPTASVLGDCPASGSSGTTVTREIERCCNVSEVDEIASGTYTIPDSNSIGDFITFINDNKADICDVSSPLYDATLCGILSGVYGDTCNPDFSPLTCGSVISSNDEIIAESVDSYNITTVAKSLVDYSRVPAPVASTVHQSPLTLDTQFVTNCMNASDLVYNRNTIQTATTCTAAQLAPVVTSTVLTAPNNVHLDYQCALSVAALQDTRNSTVYGSDFTAKLHAGAVWHKMEFNGRSNMLLEITPQAICSVVDDLPIGTEVRVSIFEDCVGLSPIYTELVDLTNGTLIDIPAASYSGNTVYIAIDAPITQVKTGTYHTAPPCGSFGVFEREIEYDSIEVSYSDLKFAKRICETRECDYVIPASDGCGVTPYKYGKFSYTESLETYPNNDELYDSRSLKVRKSDLPASIQQEFEDAFVLAIGGGDEYLLNDNADLRCKPIRHFKMPCGSVAPIMGTDPLLPFQKATVFPLGVTIDPEVVNSFLNVAVRSGLITQAQRDRISGFEIFRGDRSIHKSVLSKGIVYDMYQYEEEGDDVLYANYPYNDLGTDDLHYTNNNRNSLITHPYGGTSNHRWTYHSPDIHFEKPQLGSEMKLEGYMFGSSRGHFLPVDQHPKWVVLAQGARNAALLLGGLEVGFELAITLGEWLSNLAGTTIGGSGFAATTILAGVALAGISTIRVGKIRYEWLKTIKDNGQMKNFAHYYTSEGNYNFFSPNTDVGNNMLRGLVAADYIKAGRQRVVESDTGDGVKVNHLDRESSVYLATGSSFPITYDSNFRNYDNSRVVSSQVGAIQENKSKEVERRIASAYVSIENYVPDQYGTIDGIKWLSTGKCNKLQSLDICSPIFGGDIFLSRFSLKRKIPMFNTTAMNQANLLPFNYSFYRNIGEPRFFVDYEVNEGSAVTNLLFPNIKSELNLDVASRSSFYYKEPSRFYLYYYGIPQFIVESEINTNYRYAKKDLEDRFYPNIGDYVDWTQERNVSIKKDNTFFYNPAYSKNITPTAVRTLPSTYEEAEYNCRFDEPNGVIYSVQDNSEQDLNDPWLVYRPLDKYQFPSSSGRLIDLRPIESVQVMGRFENEAVIFNSIDTLRERLTPETESLGNGGIFAQRPVSFSKTALGYSGSQHKAMISCEFGHFWVDAKRGQVFKINQAGRNLVEISAFNEQGQPSGMRNWFKEHLPFKILKGQITNLTHENVDNEFAGLGITMGWDSRYRRIFITKRDYKVVEDKIGQVEYVDKEFRLIEGSEVISLQNTEYFEDCSWTISYSPITQTWISYYDFKPDYYINHNNYFQTGINNAVDSSETGLWSHLLTNKSFQVFYGKKYGFTIEVPNINAYSNKVLSSLEYWTDSRRYHNEYDFAENRSIAFNKGWIYNHSANSGELGFVLQEKNNLRQSVVYPKVIDNKTEILVTQSDKKWSLNTFFNRVRSQTNNVPLWNIDSNDIDKSINTDALDYRKGFQDRLRGDWFLTRLTNDSETRYKIIFKWLKHQETLYTN